MMELATKAIVVLSGGLDSTTCAAIAAADHDDVLCLSFDYGQRHRRELESATAVAKHFDAEQITVSFDARQWGASALTDDIQVPKSGVGETIPTTYVPARNTIFLSFALAVAEARGADHVYIGVNALDYSGYPDCRPEYIAAFQSMADLAMKRAVEGRRVLIETPLLMLSKADIIRRALDLDAPISLSWSCYEGGPVPCRECDSCVLRAKGFAEAGAPDPALARVEV